VLRGSIFYKIRQAVKPSRSTYAISEKMSQL